MATKSQISSFISKIAPIAQKAYQDLGKVKPSVCIAMACVECRYGTAGSCRHHSYIGQKVGTGKTATKYWDGTFFRSKTSEEYKVGVHTVIVDAFRSYKSMEQCVYNYYELLNTKLYARVLSGSSYSDQMKQIKACGYMTSSKEVNSVLNIIGNYNLTRYDEAGIYRVLKKGCKGEDVRLLQEKLNAKGYNLKTDGIFGQITTGAVMDYQKKNNLVVDGIVGSQTLKALNS